MGAAKYVGMEETARKIHMKYHTKKSDFSLWQIIFTHSGYTDCYKSWMNGHTINYHFVIQLWNIIVLVLFFLIMYFININNFSITKSLDSCIIISYQIKFYINYLTFFSILRSYKIDTIDILSNEPYVYLNYIDSFEWDLVCLT